MPHIFSSRAAGLSVCDEEGVLEGSKVLLHNHSCAHVILYASTVFYLVFEGLSTLPARVMYGRFNDPFSCCKSEVRGGKFKAKEYQKGCLNHPSLVSLSSLHGHFFFFAGFQKCVCKENTLIWNPLNISWVSR